MFGEEYTVFGEYVNSSTKILIRHNSCMNEFYIKPSTFLYEHQCPNHRYEKIAKKTRKSNEEFKEEVVNLVGDEYDVLDKYINDKTKIEFIHNTCGTKFMMSPNKFLVGNRCPNKNCVSSRISKMLIKPKEVFKKEFEIASNGEYELLSDYIKNSEKIKIKHIKCGNIFDMRAGNFLNGQRCPECSKNEISKKLKKDNDIFLSEINELYADEYSILSEYNKACDIIKVRHNKCGNIFEVTASNMLVKRSHCPNCINVSNGENLISDILNSNNINFIEQKKFDKLYGINGGHLSYDFYLPDYNLLIEYQGKQHEVPVEHFGGEEQLVVQKEHDERKRDYAKNNGFELLEIWYYDFDKINDILFEKLNLLK